MTLVLVVKEVFLFSLVLRFEVLFVVDSVLDPTLVLACRDVLFWVFPNQRLLNSLVVWFVSTRYRWNKENPDIATPKNTTVRKSIDNKGWRTNRYCKVKTTQIEKLVEKQSRILINTLLGKYPGMGPIKNQHESSGYTPTKKGTLCLVSSLI